jgi:hypothetical protein
MPRKYAILLLSMIHINLSWNLFSSNVNVDRDQSTPFPSMLSYLTICKLILASQNWIQVIVCLFNIFINWTPILALLRFASTELKIDSLLISSFWFTGYQLFTVLFTLDGNIWSLYAIVFVPCLFQLHWIHLSRQ